MKKESLKISVTVILAAALVVATAILLITTYHRFNKMSEKICWDRLEESAGCSVEKLDEVYEFETKLLKGLSTVLFSEENVNSERCLTYLQEASTLLSCGEIGIIGPEEQYVSYAGTIRKIDKPLDFNKLSRQKRFRSEIDVEIEDSAEQVLRHYMSVIREGKVKAVVYCSLDAKDLEQVVEGDLYGGKASAYLIEKSSGKFLANYGNSAANLKDGIRDFKRINAVKLKKLEKEYESGVSGKALLKRTGGNGDMLVYHVPTTLKNYELAIAVPGNIAFYEAQHFQMVAISLVTVEIVLLILFYVWIARKNKKEVDIAVKEERNRRQDINSRSKLNFISNLSQDIRTPLNAILSFTSLARTNIDNKERISNYLEKISNTSQHLNQLIDEALNMLQISTGQMVLEKNPTNIPNLANALKKDVERMVDMKRIRFEIKLQNLDEENVYVDRKYLRKAIYNLLSSAIKHTPMGSRVDLIIAKESEVKGDEIEYSFKVTDSGDRISEENLVSIFEPLENVYDSSGGSLYGLSSNTGLGLATTKSIVEFMNGTITASNNVDEGTSFIIKLPVQIVRLQQDIEKAEAPLEAKREESF